MEEMSKVNSREVFLATAFMSTLGLESLLILKFSHLWLEKKREPIKDNGKALRLYFSINFLCSSIESALKVDLRGVSGVPRM